MIQEISQILLEQLGRLGLIMQHPSAQSALDPNKELQVHSKIEQHQPHLVQHVFTDRQHQPFSYKHKMLEDSPRVNSKRVNAENVNSIYSVKTSANGESNAGNESVTASSNQEASNRHVIQERVLDTAQTKAQPRGSLVGDAENNESGVSGAQLEKVLVKSDDNKEVVLNKDDFTLQSASDEFFNSNVAPSGESDEESTDEGNDDDNEDVNAKDEEEDFIEDSKKINLEAEHEDAEKSKDLNKHYEHVEVTGGRTDTVADEVSSLGFDIDKAKLRPRVNTVSTNTPDKLFKMILGMENMIRSAEKLPNWTTTTVPNI